MILSPSELVLTFGGSYVCANFGENRSRNSIVRVLAEGQTHTLTHTQTDTNQFYNLSHAICYSYGTDKTQQQISPSVNVLLFKLVEFDSKKKNFESETIGF